MLDSVPQQSDVDSKNYVSLNEINIPYYESWANHLINLVRRSLKIYDNEGVDKSLVRYLKIQILDEKNKIAKSMAVKANIIDLLSRLIERNITPDLLTDQTSAHDPLVGYIPHGLTNSDADKLLEQITDKYDLPDKSKALRCLLDYVEEKESEWDEMFATIRCNRCG